MRKGFLFLVISIFAANAYSQIFMPVTTPFPGLIYSSSAWGDYDNDGDLDLLISGKEVLIFDDKTIAYRNDGNGVFAELNLTLPWYWKGSCNWVDIDGDKDLDMFVSGDPPGGMGPSNTIFRNDGNDTFVNINLQGSGSNISHYVDIDNDGDIDIGILGSGIDFLLNDGEGNFSHFYSDIYSLAQEFYFPDVDNDGDADVFVYMTSDYSVNTKLFINNGNMTFTESTSPFVQMKSSSAAWGDLDDDGDLDLLIAGDAAGGVQTVVYENTNGIFAQVADTLVNLNFSSTLLADFDNDGDLDICLSGQVDFNHDSTYIYLNNGSFSFTPLSQQFSWFGDVSVSITDYDSDNDIDIFALGSLYGNSPSELYRNDISVANTAPIPPTNISSSIQNDKLILSWDNGSDAETDTLGLCYNVEIFNLATGKYIVVPMSDSLTGRRMVLDMGNAQQAMTKTFDLNNFDIGPCQVRVQSIDHGYRGSAFSTPISVIISPTSTFITDKDNLPVNDTLLVTYIGNCDTSAIFTWDFDSAIVLSGSGMGPYQLTWASQGSKIISLEVTQNGVTSYMTSRLVNVGQAFIQISTSIQPLVFSMFAWGDYDNDNDLDIVYTGLDEQNLPVTNLWRNDGNDQFTLIPTSIVPVRPNSVAWGDYDNNGLLDLLISGFDTANNGSISIYMNEGNNTFSELATNLPSVSHPYCEWFDMDNNGDLDILLAYNPISLGSIKICRNIGYGNFEISNEAYSAGFMKGNRFDFDNDGDQDVITNEFFFKNLGNCHFINTYCDLPLLVERSRCADFNNDGWMDFLVIGYDDYYPQTYIFENDGTGDFSIIPIDLCIEYNDPNFDFGDFDNDGDLDILLCGRWTVPIDLHDRVYENKGNYQFEEINIPFPYAKKDESRWVDYDNDGDLDITSAAGESTEYSFFIFRNEIDYSNHKPGPPANLNTNLTSGHLMEFSWDMATDLETNDTTLTYNFYLYKVGGDTIFTSHANIHTGFKKVVGYGNMGFRRQFTFTATEIGEYRWSVQSVDNNFEGSAFAPEQSVTIVGIDESEANKEMQLYQNIPNPFSGKTNIGFYIPQSEDIELNLYDNQGKLIQVLASGRFEKGNHSVEFNSGDLAFGNYYYSLKAGNGTISRKMIVGK
ncbi:MAG: T9SS type A sorting domain-containing protein [Bacteroidales bacterium]|nr:T9SS type A sorting domain-containing protein [Bacteroidales bacterium]MCF8457481.1 T9SS type A sorting domain-containing protein [Bacteroidales bacterium]